MPQVSKGSSVVFVLDVLGRIVEAIVEEGAPMGQGRSQPLITAEDVEDLGNRGKFVACDEPLSHSETFLSTTSALTIHRGGRGKNQTPRPCR